MHAVKVERHDTAARQHFTNTGVRPVDTYREHPHGLFVARPFVAHPRIRHWQAHLLPELGIQLCRYQWHTGQLYDYYIDIASISRSGPLWEVRDHYLDILLWDGERAEVVDTEELSASLRAGLLGQEEALAAVERLHRVLNGLGQHGYRLDAWLAACGIELSWQAVPELAAPELAPA